MNDNDREKTEVLGETPVVGSFYPLQIHCAVWTWTSAVTGWWSTDRAMAWPNFTNAVMHSCEMWHSLRRKKKYVSCLRKKCLGKNLDLRRMFRVFEVLEDRRTLWLIQVTSNFLGSEIQEFRMVCRPMTKATHKVNILVTKYSRTKQLARPTTACK